MRYGFLLLVGLFFGLQLLVMYYYSTGGETITESSLPSMQRDPLLSLPGGPLTTHDNPDRGSAAARGTVTLNGAPAPHVEVVLEQRPADDADLLQSSKRSNRWRTATDERGGFEFLTLAPGFYVALARTDTAHAAMIFDTNENSPAQLDLALQPNQPRSGKVMDANGKPLSKAYVYPLPESDEQAVLSAYSWLPVPTASDGSFQFAWLRAEPLRLLVVGNEFAPLLTPLLDADALHHDIVLDKGNNLHVSVLTEENEPATRTKVRVREAGLGVETSSAHTDRDGLCTIPFLRPGTYEVWIDSERWALPERPLQVEVSALESSALDIHVVPGHKLAGRVVVDGTNRGVADVVVTATHPASAIPFFTTTDKSGKYRLAGLCAGEYDIAIQVPDEYHADQNKTQVVLAAGRRPDSLQFAVKEGLTFAGTVIDVDGKPSTDCTVTCGFDGNDFRRSVRCDILGRFMLKGIPEADGGRVWAEAKGTRSAALDLNPQAQPLQLRLEYSSRGRIAGEVLDEAGTGLPSAVVQIEAPDEFWPSTRLVETDPWGSFVVEGLIPGDYRLVAGPEAESLQQDSAQHLVLEADSTATAKLTLQ